MSFEMTDHVPGLKDEEVAELVKEAEAGYDLASHETEPNPHFQRAAIAHRDASAQGTRSSRSASSGGTS